MRKIAFILMILIFLTVARATKVTIQTVPFEGKPGYTLQVGDFAHQNNALQLKFKLSSIINHPMVIEQSQDTDHYLVK